ncbi:MAG: type II secretion system minor pseudopilin GspK [Hyphomonadaceae bacterium]|nr:type II secretion system minor pseudopilin GspK [Hyphomonadaceae bacterium]
MKRGANSEAGAALVTVLVMLAIMSALAIVITDAARFSLRRTANQAQMDQARWYLLGAENYAATRITRITQQLSTDLPIDQEQWQGRPFLYPLDDGDMTITLFDGGNCFNLNSVVERPQAGPYVASARGQLQFARLLDLVGVRVEGGLAASLADWIDSDQQAALGGGEDEIYSRGEAPYRTANTLIADIGELRRVRGFDAETVARIAPFVCVRPTEAPSVLNVNALTSEQAPLLAMVIPDLSIDGAREVIRSRPRGGWRDLNEFFQQPRLIGLELNEPTRAQFALTSSYFVMQARVERAEFAERSAALIRMDGSRGRVVRRLFGVGGAERVL